MSTLNKYGNFKPLGKYQNKKQIILCHTSREVDRYLTSLRFRYNQKFDRIPNFIITKKGEVLQLLDESSYTRFFYNEEVNKNSIIVCLENLGWLEKKPLSKEYISWDGSIYNEKVYEKKWRDFFFWEPYSDIQIKETSEICSKLIEFFQIKKSCVGHNTKVDGIEKFEGISTRSNYDQRFTDLNPSFNFENFVKFLENEQFA